MKAIAFILLFTSFWTLDGLGQDKEIKSLFDNSEKKTEIFNTILNDHNLMMEFMDAMKNNDHAMMMMQNSSMMGNSSSGGMQMSGEHHMTGEMGNENETVQHMMGVMKDNPEMMPEMMGNMMAMCEKDSTLCEGMTKVMSQHPHMMKMSMQKMDEKGLTMHDENMKMMDPSESSEGSMHQMHK
jgi:hypothetical protein